MDPIVCCIVSHEEVRLMHVCCVMVDISVGKFKHVVFNVNEEETIISINISDCLLKIWIPV